MASDVSESQFVCYGLRKDGWHFVDEKLVKQFIDNPELLDVKSAEFLERWFYYYEWYWRNQLLTSKA